MSEAPQQESTLVAIPADEVLLEGELSVPSGASGLVIFAHGSGSGRHSRRNRYVARAFNDAGMATLLADLLSAEEAENYESRFDMELLTGRLARVLHWTRRQPETRHFSAGLFGSSTGAAAALCVAAQSPLETSAVVSRGGRVDLAAACWGAVRAPVLLIVGSEDAPVIPLNREAYQELRAEAKELQIVPGAGHLFEEPGALARVADLSSAWFRRYLRAGRDVRLAG